MPLSPVSRRELIARLRRLGFSGPYAGGRHEYMERAKLQVTLPNPHRGDIGVPLLETPGHTQLATTMDIYTHVMPAMRQEVADQLDALLGG